VSIPINTSEELLKAIEIASSPGFFVSSEPSAISKLG